MAGPTPVKVACLALGSRGDVEPLLAVLERLLTLAPSAHVTLACREEVWDEIVAHRPARAGVTLAPVRPLSVAMARAMHARKQVATRAGREVPSLGSRGGTIRCGRSIRTPESWTLRPEP